jgi:translation initiation factor 2 subunit 1
MTSETDYPEQGELVIGTVKNIFNQGAFIDLDEYTNKRGMLHITEISLKWVRNIRDYVKEGQKVVLVVLRVDPGRGHIDLSLRRVTDAARKQKLQQVKQKQRATKLMELVATELATDKNETITTITKALSGYESLYAGFEAIAANPKIADGFGLTNELKKSLIDLIGKNIKLPVVEINGFVEFRSFEPDGIKAIRGALAEIQKHKIKEGQVEISYVSAPLYRVRVCAPDYKSAEKTMRNAVDQGISYIESKHGTGEFHRELPAK